MYEIKNLAKLKRLEEKSPETMKAFSAFDKSSISARSYRCIKQIMAAAVALTTQCPYCIALHVKSARDAGATDQMLIETATVAAAMRAGAGDHPCYSFVPGLTRSTEPQNRRRLALVRGPFALDNELRGRRIRSAESDKEGPRAFRPSNRTNSTQDSSHSL